MFHRRRVIPLLAAALVALAPVAPTSAQPATSRTPNQEGTWVTPGGTAFFSFLHRFSVGPGPDHSVSNFPTFHLSAGLMDWLSLGALYATETATPVSGSQELELFAKQILLNEANGAPVSLSLKEAFNTAALSPDLEIAVQRHFGPVGLIGTVRGLGNFRYKGQPRLVTGLGASFAVTPNLVLAADAAVLPIRTPTEGFLIWGAGAQIQIPYTPHTLSIQATNAATDTIHGSSVDLGSIRYGFDFTIPFTNGQQWLDIFKPAKKAAAPSRGAEPKGMSTAEAKAFFNSRCVACHGAGGAGGFGPDLRPVEAKGDAFIAQRIQKGSPKGMPPFEAQLSAAEVRNLVEYVKSL